MSEARPPSLGRVARSMLPSRAVRRPADHSASGRGPRTGTAPRSVRVLTWTGWPRAAGAALAGAGLGLAFPPAGLWPLAFVAVGALSLLVRGCRGRRAAAVSFAFALAFFVVLLQWLHVIGWDAVLALAVLQAAFYAPLGTALAWTATRGGWPLWHACAWVAVEAARARVPFGGFPWGKLAFSQADSPLAPLAALGGTPAVSFAAAGIGTAAAGLAVAVWRLRVRAGAAAVACAGAVLVGGVAVPLPTTGEEQVTAAVVQGDVPRPELDPVAQADAVFTNHLQATHALAERVEESGAAGPDLVIWPENAADIDPLDTVELGFRIDAAVRHIDAPVLVGAVVDTGGETVHNSGIVWTPRGGPEQVYTKRHPVPFGEYVPFRDLLTSVIGRFAEVPRDFEAGERVGNLTLGDVPAGVVICFEVAYDGLVRDVVRGGGQLLVVQTNNATYGRTGQPEQQLAISRLRSIEHGRAMLIAATSGISAVVDPDGSLRAATDEFTRDVLVEQVPLRNDRTVATRVGPWPEWTLCLLALVAIVMCAPRRTSDIARSRPVTVRTRAGR